MSRARFALIGLGLGIVLVGCQNVGIGSSGGPVGLPGLFGSMTQLATGGGRSVEVDEPEEIELGRAVTTSVGSRYKLLRDESLTRYVALVGNAVAVQSERPDLRYYFAVLDTDEVNAFAAPGGYVFITRGTLAVMRDEATLAGVLGHEVGHIALHHYNATIKKEKETALKRGFLTTVGHIGLGFVPGPGGAAASVFGSPALNLIADGIATVDLRGFSRDEEEEADRVGFRYAARAGYDPAGLRDFLKAVQDAGKQPAKSGFFTKFVSTHPGSADRLKEQETQLRTAPAGGRRAAARFQQAIAAQPTTR